MSITAFERYAPFIQEYIYRRNWTDLREVQVEACDAILDTDYHVIIASGTASGKTEAAFFPVLTALQQNSSNTIGIMYIGPLKALINDQFERLSGLLEDRDIPVWPWHGDISPSVKMRALKEVRGILQITPESLEALLMRHPGDAVRLFSDLRFVIIDEIHALMGADRGLQVMCLLSRLERLAACSPRRIGLSATLNDYALALQFLSAGSKQRAIAVGMNAHKRTISLCAESFLLPPEEEKAELVLEAYNQFLYDNCHNKKCLIFTNSRSDAEMVIANMKNIAAKEHDRDIFYVHHGSVSAALRHEAEAALRDHHCPTVAAATLTLELGIDIGDLDSTIQIGAPYSCSSFVQRLGRSGRRTGKSQMMFVDVFEESHKSPFDMLPWNLLRAIAIIQLYIEDRWVEPFTLKKKPFSLLAHQTLSTLMTYGDLMPAALAEQVLTLPVFQGVTQEDYRLLLQNMIAEDYLQRVESGGIIPGLKGERIANHYSFYAVFQDEQSYHVHSQTTEIGTLDSCPGPDEVFILAGRCWMVQSIDEERKIIYVKQVKNQRIPSWSGSAGKIHTRIVTRMKEVLREEVIYPYLQPGAAEIITQARQLVKKTAVLDADIIPIDEHSFYLCPWMGTKELSTIKALLTNGLKHKLKVYSAVGSQHHLHITTGLSVTAFAEMGRQLNLDVHCPDLVLPMDRTPKIDKYDPMVPDILLRKAALYNQFDVSAAVDFFRKLSVLH